MYVYIRAKKNNSTGGGTLAQMGRPGGGVYGLKQPSMLDYLRNRWTRTKRKGPYLPSNTCIYNAERNIRNERVAVHIYTRL